MTRISRRAFAECCSALAVGAAAPRFCFGQTGIALADYRPCLDVDPAFAPESITNGALNAAPVRESRDDPPTATDIALIEQNEGAAARLTGDERLAEGASPVNSTVQGGDAAARELGLPANSPPARLAALTRWKDTDELKVYFYGGGSTALRNAILDIASLWSEFAKMSFKPARDRVSADIRIAFQNTGHWSYMGPTNSTGQTMNLQMNAPPRPGEYDYGVILHEFGHALGCIHEHQQPGASGLFNERAVIDYYARQYRWDAAKTRLNVLNRYQRTKLLRDVISEFDKSSIMIYSYPAELTLDGQGTPSNTTLSRLDKQFIAKLYPGKFDPDSLDDGDETDAEPEPGSPSQVRSLVIDGDPVRNRLTPAVQVHEYAFEVESSKPVFVQTWGITKVDATILKPGSAKAMEAKWRSTPDLVNLVEEHVLAPGEYRLRVQHMLAGGVGEYEIRLTSSRPE
jgi:hypothetical protein